MKCDELNEKIQITNDTRMVYLKSEVDEAIPELKAENERLKRCEIWMEQHFYCEEVIACESAKNRRLRRVLWLARAKRAIAEAEYWYGHMSGMYYIDATDVPDEDDDLIEGKIPLWDGVKLG